MQNDHDLFALFGEFDSPVNVINANVRVIQPLEELTEQPVFFSLQLFTDSEGELSSISDSEVSWLDLKVDFALLLLSLDSH